MNAVITAVAEVAAVATLAALTTGALTDEWLLLAMIRLICAHVGCAQKETLCLHPAIHMSPICLEQGRAWRAGMGGRAYIGCGKAYGVGVMEGDIGGGLQAYVRKS